MDDSHFYATTQSCLAKQKRTSTPNNNNYWIWSGSSLNNNANSNSNQTRCVKYYCFKEEAVPPAKPYDNPRLYSDTVSLMTMLIKKHKSMDRTFRILFMEQKIYPLLASVMENSLKMQFLPHAEKKNQIDVFDNMRVSLEIVKSYLTICFEAKQISQTLYLQAYRKTEEISKQALGWKNHLLSSKKPESQKS